MDIPCGGGCGVRFNIGSLFMTVGAKYALSISCSGGFVVGKTNWVKLVHVFVLIGLFEFVGERKQE